MVDKIIAVDLDNVIAETDPKVREIIQRISGVFLSQEDINDFEYHKSLISKGMGADHARKIEKKALKIFHDSECIELGLVNGAAEGVAKLMQSKFSVIIVTSRPTRCKKNTESWLVKVGIPYDRLLFLDNKVNDAKNWDMLIEDSPYHAEAVCKSGVPVCLLDYPWNRSIVERELIYRAKNWGEIIKIISELIIS